MKHKIKLLTLCISIVMSAFGQTNTVKSKSNHKMENNSVKASIKINATPSQLWNVLTTPEKISQFTGSKVETDWNVGSTISWSGEMQGTPYKNKGKILELKPNKLLRHSFWTGMGGDADQPENYSEVSYSIKQLENNTIELTYSRIKIATEMEAQMFQQHIQSMLDEIKRLSEN